MKLAVYRSTRSIYLGDHRVDRWDEWCFAPVPSAMWDNTTTQLSRNKIPVERTFTHRRSPPDGHLVATPPLATCDGLRVFPSGDRFGVDAASVWYLASRGERGFRLIESGEDDLRQATLFELAPEQPADATAGAFPRRQVVKRGPADATAGPPAAAVHAPAPEPARDAETPAPAAPATEEEPGEARRRHPVRGYGRGYIDVPPAHVACDEAGADLVLDVDRARKFIVEGSGATALRLLEVVAIELERRAT